MDLRGLLELSDACLMQALARSSMLNGSKINFAGVGGSSFGGGAGIGPLGAAEQCNFTDLEGAPISTVQSDDEFDILKRIPVAVAVVCLGVLVATLGFLGNLLVVITVATTARMRNATNIFIANLAVADVFVCVFDLPLNLYYILTDNWIYGRILCKIIPAGFAFVVYLSALSMVLIAIDRFLLIVHPSRKRITPSVAMLLLLAIVSVAALVASPIGVFSRIIRHDDEKLKVHFRYCIEDWPKAIVRKVYTVATLVVQFLVPLIVIAILYSLVFRKVRASRKQTKSSRRKSKTNSMLVAVVAVFGLAWTPYQLFSLVSEFQPGIFTKYYKFTDLMLRIFAMSSSCVNPFLYGWLNDNFRTAFLGIIGWRKPASGQQQQQQTRCARAVVDVSQQELSTNVIELSAFASNRIE